MDERYPIGKPELVDSLTPGQFARVYVHPEQGRRVGLDEALQTYAWHGRHHAAHVLRLRERKGW